MDRTQKIHLTLFILALIIVLFAAFFKAKGLRSPVTSTGKMSPKDVSVPTIVAGELVLPEVVPTTSSLDKEGPRMRLRAISANLFGVTAQTQKLSAIRILGELENIGDRIISEYSPVIRFYGASNEILGQKIGRLSSGFSFYGLGPGQTGVYDVTVEDPPEAEKLEIILNVVSASASAEFEQLEIAGKTLEVKRATYQGDEASPSAEETIDYFAASGRVVNTFADPTSDIVIYAWVKDGENKVFALGKQDFRNDLLDSGKTIDFKIILLPLKVGHRFENYEVQAWGKRYRLNF